MSKKTVFANKTAFVVIGAGYGDEGKGITTAALVKQFNIEKVFRFNGGPQAGHTVVNGDKRHVFSHYNSGLMFGAETYFGNHTICNPIVARQELDVMKTAGIVTTAPPIYYHGNCKFSTIYDMIINNLVETQRGDDAHGSCGMGINETIRRYEAGFGFNFELWGNIQPKLVHNFFMRIMDEWVPRRLKELGITKISNEMQNLLNIYPKIHAQHFIDDLEYCNFRSYSPYDASGDYQTGDMVYEGAQGLMLDEQFGDFPHVTPSMTGLPQAIDNVKELYPVVDIQPVYVTRTFATRHGNGPFAGGNPFKTSAGDFDYVDTTNVTNQFQGSFKYGILNLDKMFAVIEKDLIRGRAIGLLNRINILPPKIFISHMDVKMVNIHYQGESLEVETGELLDIIASYYEVMGFSTGPDVADVMFI